MTKPQILTGTIFATDATDFGTQLAEQEVHGGRTAALAIAERPVGTPKAGTHRFASLIVKGEPKAGKRIQIDLSLLSKTGMFTLTALEVSLISEPGAELCYAVTVEAPSGVKPELMNEADVRQAIEAHLTANLVAEGIQNTSTSLMLDTKVNLSTAWVGVYYPNRSVGTRIESLTPISFVGGKKAQYRTFVRQLTYAGAFYGLVLTNGNTMYFVPARNVIEAIKKSSGQNMIELASYARPIAVLPKPAAFISKVEFTVLPNGTWTIQVVATTSETGRLDAEEKQAYCLNLSFIRKGGAAVQVWEKSLDKNDKIHIGRVLGSSKPLTASFTLGSNGDVNVSFADEDGSPNA